MSALLRGRGLRAVLSSSALVAEAAALALVFFCPLALGTVHLWAIVGMLALALLAAGALTLRGLPRPERLEWWLFGIAAFVALQRLPLPDTLSRLLSPNSADLYAFSLAGTAGAGWHPLSLDGPATSRELLKALAYAFLFLAGGGLAASRRRRRRLTLALGLAGFAVGFIGIGHKLFNVTELFGLPLFRAATSPLTTTFGNRNNAAGFLCLTLPILLSLGLRGSKRGWIFFGPAYVLTAVALFLTLSRGGMAAFFAGHSALVLLLWKRRSLEVVGPRRRLLPTVAGLGVILALAAVAYVSADSVLPRINELAEAATGTPEGKIEGFRQSLGMLRDFPLVGIGKGAFPTVSGHYLTFDVQTAEYVENEVLQLPIDLGLPLGLATLALLALAFFRAVRRSADSLSAAGLAAGLVALAAQNLGDYSLELGGIAAPALLAFAALREEGRHDGDRPRLGRWRSAGLLLAAAAVVPFCLSDAAHAWRAETDAFAESAPQLTAKEAVAGVTPLLERHPASFVLPLAVGERFLAERSPGPALQWINKAMYLKPPLALGHALAAQALAELGQRDQALLEARLFAENGGGVALLPFIGARFSKIADLTRAVPDTPAGLLDLANYLLQQHRPEDARVVAQQAVERAPQDAAVRRGFAQLLLAQGDFADAEVEAQAAIDLAPADPDAVSAYAALSSAREGQGKAPGARQALESGLKQLPGNVPLTLALVRLQLRQNHPTDALDRLKLLGPQHGSAQRAEVFALSAEVYLALGQENNAEDAYRNATRLRPGEGYEGALAKLLEGQGHFAEAARALRELEAKADPAQKPELERHIAEDDRRAGELEVLSKRQLLLGPRGQ